MLVGNGSHSELNKDCYKKNTPFRGLTTNLVLSTVRYFAFYKCHFQQNIEDTFGKAINISFLTKGESFPL